MRAFTVDVVALALEVERKYLDNLLSHHAIPGCVGVRQGVRRRIDRGGVARLAIAIMLARELGIPLARAVDAACQLHANGAIPVDGAGRGGGVAEPELRITVDLPALERRLDRQLASAVESAREPRRGRPPARPRGVPRRAGARG